VASSEIDTLKEFTLSNFDLIKELKVCLLKKDEKIAELAKEVDYVSGADDEVFLRILIAPFFILYS